MIFSSLEGCNTFEKCIFSEIRLCSSKIIQCVGSTKKNNTIPSHPLLSLLVCAKTNDVTMTQ